MIRIITSISLVAIGAVALSGIPTLAQQQQQPADTQQEQPTTPIPAIRSPLAGATDNGDADVTGNSQQLTPDTRSLTGVEDLSLGTIPLTHSYWQPRASLLANVDSNPDYSTGSGDWSTWTTLTAGVDIHRVSGLSDLMLSYTGGGMFSNGGDVENGVIQQLGLKEKLSFRRSTFSVFEQLSYLPESSFGFSGTAGATLPGSGGISLGAGFTPGQSLLTPRGQNLSSSTAVEYDYRLTARTSLTVLGSYALLHYDEDGLADYGDASFQAGYNYQLTRKDTIAVSYLYNAIRYSNENQSINANTVQGVYGRRVTGHLAFQIAIGPQFVSSTSPITGSTPTSSPTTASTSSLYWALNSSLTYQLRRASITASYNHGVTGGSGLLAGAETDIVTG